jgi:ABC-type sugar transport system ATPase subunit
MVTVPNQEGAEYLLEARDVVKHYEGVTALGGTSRGVKAGEIHALLGGNGAGKSTLIAAISGVIKPDSGHIFLDGQRLDVQGPMDAIAAGVTTIYQELSLVPALSILDNVFLGRELQWRVARIPVLTDRRAMEVKISELATSFGIGAEELRAPVSEFGALKNRSVEIVKALAFDSKVLVLDEPTSGLEDAERQVLFTYMRKLQGRGVALIWVTHHLEELFGLADRATVLRDGSNVITVDVASTSLDELVSAMFGVSADALGGSSGAPTQLIVDREDDVVVSARNLTRGSAVRDVSFEVQRGEILGLAGLAGAGRTEIVRALMGLDKMSSGVVEIEGRRQRIGSSSSAYRAGLAMLPEDRKQLGILPELTTAQNISISRLSSVSLARTWVSRRKERQLAEDFRSRLGIKTPDVETRVGNLSGGNQQKTIVARCLNTEPKVLIFDEPTQGIDVSAKREVHDLVRQYAEDGGAAILIASEFEELLELSHRVLVIRKGQVVGEVRDVPQAIAERSFATVKSELLRMSAAGDAV